MWIIGKWNLIYIVIGNSQISKQEKNICEEAKDMNLKICLTDF